MTTNSTPQGSNLVPQVVAEWRERLLRGERFAVEEYTTKYPEIAEELRELYSAVVMIEDLKGDIGDLTGSVGSGVGLPGGVPTLERLGDFRILREVGRGGMGIVYEAEQESLGRHVALKVLPVQAMLDSHHQKRFQREAKAAARMHHTNIVPVYGVGEHEGMCYYVMQFIQGLGLDGVLAELKKLREARLGITPSSEAPTDHVKSVAAAGVAKSLLTGVFNLAQLSADEPMAPSDSSQATTQFTKEGLAPNERAPEKSLLSEKTMPVNLGGPPSRPVTVSPSASGSSVVVLDQGDKSTLTESGRHFWRSVARLALQVADALDYAHQQGILHRDIKPSNLLLDTMGTLWVTDFGLAKASADADNLTHTGDIVGTMRYMAPERFNGVSDARGDIYSLGLTLYELAVQRPAYEEKDRNRLIKQVTHGAPTPPRKLNRAIPRDLETIILKAIDREPARRYQTARAMAEDLRRFIDDKPILARQAGVVERLWRWSRRNPAVAGLSAAVLLLLVGLAFGSTLVAIRFQGMARDESTLRQVAEQSRERINILHEEALTNLDEAERQKKLAEDNFHKARSAVDTSLTKVSESKLLNVPGLQPLRKELLESALQFYEGFLRQRSTDPALQKDLAIAYAKAARITAEIGSKEKALDFYQQGMGIWNKLLEADPKNLALETEIAALHHAIGGLRLQVGDLPRSLDSFQEASRILREVIPRSQDKAHLLVRFAAINNAIGAVYIQKGERLEAMSYYEAALKLQRELVQENPKHPRLVEFRYELAIQINRMGELNRKIGLVAEASKLHKEALKILTDLKAAAPQGEIADDLQRALAASHEHLGDVHKANDQADDALLAYEKALPIRLQLATANPAVTDYQSEVGQTYLALAALQAELGEPNEAASYYQKGVERQRTAVAAAPQVENSRLLGQLLAGLGQARLQLGKPAEARPGYNEAHTIFKKIAQPTAEDLYYLARIRAAYGLLISHGKSELTPEETKQKQSEFNQALASIRQAFGSGFHDVGRLQRDAEFADLRAAKDFQALIADMQQKSKGIPWNPDFEAAKSQAAREKKDLFVYFTGSDWCYWCLLVRKEVFGKAAFNEYAPSYFVPVELDFPKGKANPPEYARNKALMESWGLQGFPSLILADAEGRPYANLREGKGRDTAAGYIELMEKLRKQRQARDDLLTKAQASAGLEKAKLLDQALGLVNQDFWGIGYADVVAQIIQLDSEDKAGLRTKYFSVALDQRRSDIKSAMKKQDWDGTIVKIDQIIAELNPTGTAGAAMWLDRARAYAKLRQWDKAEADYDRVLELKPDDVEVRIERAQFYKDRGQPERALKEFAAAIEPRLEAIETARENFNSDPDDPKSWRDLSEGYRKLGEVQRKAGRPAEAMTSALQRSKLFPGSSGEIYNAACELALCVPLIGHGEKPSADLLAQKQKCADLAMDNLRAAVLLGTTDARQMKKDPDLYSLRGRADYQALERALSPSDRFPPIGFHSREFKGHSPPLIESVAVAPDSSRVLSAGFDNTVRLWDVKTGKEIRRLEGHKGLVHALAFAGDGRRVVTAGSDGTLRIWDADTGKAIRRLEGHKGAVRGVAISADGKLVLSAGQDQSLRLWNAETGEGIRRLEGHRKPILAVALTPDGRRAISSGADAVLHVWDVSTGKSVHKFQFPQIPATCVAITDDGKRAVAGLAQGVVYLLDLEKKQRIRMHDTAWAPLRGIAFSRDGRQALAASTRSGVLVWDLQSGRVAYRLGAGLPCGGLAVAANGQWLATANSDGVHWWSLAAEAIRARDLARIGQVEGAEAAYAEAVKQRGGDGDLRLERARFYARLAQWDKAIADYDKAIEGGSLDSDTRLERGRCQAELGRWDQATADFDAALTALEGDPNGAGRINKVCEEAVQWEKVFDKLAATRPKNAAFPLAQGRRLAQQSQWSAAAAAMARSVDLKAPDDMVLWFQHGCLRILAGDMEGYRSLCARLLSRREEKKDSSAGSRLARLGAMAPNAVADFKVVEAAADKDLGRGGNKAYWALELRGALAYRAGRYEQALAPLRECLLKFPKWEGQTVTWLWLAMTQHQLGRREEALKSLAKADEWFAKHGKVMPAPAEATPPAKSADPSETVIPLTLADWLQAHVLRREAEQLINSPRTAARK